jgi:multidrug transporter EmrE-like cation transporter
MALPHAGQPVRGRLHDDSEAWRQLQEFAGDGGFLVCVFLSLLFLELANRSIPLGPLTRSGPELGRSGTVVIGMIWFAEPATLISVALIIGIVACAIGLKLTSGQ